MLATKFWFILLSGFRGEDFLDIDQPEKRIANAAIFLMDQNEIKSSPLKPLSRYKICMAAIGCSCL
jgi:hypothetical protein